MSNGVMPSPEELTELGREIECDCQRGREAMAKAARSPEWAWNKEVYSGQQSGPEASTRAGDFGRMLAGRSEKRDSWQSQMSESGEPLGPFSAPFSLLTRSEVMGLRAKARTVKGRRQLRLLAASLADAELAFSR